MAIEAVKRMSDEDFEGFVRDRRIKRMEQIDSLPAPLRECVHDYGWTVVNTCLDLGITKPRHIRHLVETVLNEFSPTRGSSAAQGKRAALGVTNGPHD